MSVAERIINLIAGNDSQLRKKALELHKERIRSSEHPENFLDPSQCVHAAREIIAGRAEINSKGELKLADFG